MKKDQTDKILLGFDLLHIFFVHLSKYLTDLLLHCQCFAQNSNRIRGFLVGALFQVEGIQRKGSIALVFKTGKTSMGNSDTRMWIRMNESPKECISFEVKTQNKHNFTPFRFDHHLKLKARMSNQQALQLHSSRVSSLILSSGCRMFGVSMPLLTTNPSSPLSSEKCQ